MITPVRELPGGGLFHSDRGVYDFQAEGLAELYAYTDPGQHDGRLAVWDGGIGKTVLSLLMGVLLYENDEIDQMIVVCERNKIREWVADVERFTGLSVLRYHDPGRHKRLDRHGVPHVLVTVYETARDELLVRTKSKTTRGPGSASDGPLFDRLGLRDKRIYWVFDEPIKFKNRSSGLYKAFDRTLGHLRRGKHHQRVIGLSMAPFDTAIDQAFNVGRIIFPSLMPSVGEFEEHYTHGVDDFGRYRIKHGMKQVFAHRFQQGVSRKRKTDPDVIEQFPKLIEESAKISMEKPQRDLYNAVSTMLDPEGEDGRSDDQFQLDNARIRTLLRLTAGHPCAHLHVGNELSKLLVEELGEDYLRKVGSAKTRWLIEHLDPLVKGQGAQVIIFEYYTSVLTEVAEDLRGAGYTVVEYHGGLRESARERALDEFKAGEHEILFMSDAGARGLNIREAQYVIEYSSSTTYSNRSQRIMRNHRIDSDLPSTTALTMVALDTVEEDIFAGAINRNRDLDTLVGDREDDTEFVSAHTRRQRLGAVKRKKENVA